MIARLMCALFTHKFEGTYHDGSTGVICRRCGGFWYCRFSTVNTHRKDPS